MLRSFWLEYLVNGPSLKTGRIFVECKSNFMGFCYFPLLSSKLTLSLNLKAQTSFFLSFLFLFLHTLCFSFSSPPSLCLVSWSLLVSSFSIYFTPPPPLPHSFLSLSVHPSLPAALWQQSVMGLGCRRAVKAPPCPSSSSSASLHPCCPLPKGPAPSIFTQVIRWAETHRRLCPQGGQTLILFTIQISLFQTN